MNSLKAAKALLRKEIKLKVAALTVNEKQRQSKIVVEKVYILKERNILYMFSFQF
jgi:tRNA(Ile)-lysidine synthase TilS/MesJ